MGTEEHQLVGISVEIPLHPYLTSAVSLQLVTYNRTKQYMSPAIGTYTPLQASVHQTRAIVSEEPVRYDGINNVTE